MVNADGIKQIVQLGDSRYWTILFVQSVLYIPTKTAEDTIPAAIIPSSIKTVMKIRATVTTKMNPIKKIAQSASINRNVSIASSGTGNGAFMVS